MPPSRVEWLWPGYVPLGNVTLLDGDPGLGKSTLLLDLAARGSVGGKTPTGDRLETFDTLLVTGEDDASTTIRPRLDQAGGDPSRVHVIDMLTLPDQTDELEHHVIQTNARLLVIDPVVAFLGEQVRTASDHAVRRALRPLAAVAARRHCAVVAVRHLSKEDDRSAIYRGGGSIGFAGMARSVLAIARDPDDEDQLVVAVIKSNLGKRPPSIAYRLAAEGPYDPARIEWVGESVHSAERLIGRHREREQSPSKVDQLATAVREIVADAGGEVAAQEAVAALEAGGWSLNSQAQLQTARRRAGVETTKAGFDGPWMWRLPLSIDIETREAVGG